MALKLLHEPQADALYNFKREFRTLADIGHPNLVGPYELLSMDTQWFFTMELVNGVNIFHWLRGGDPGRTPTALAPSFCTDKDFPAFGVEEPWGAEEEVKQCVYSPPLNAEAIRPIMMQLAQGLHFLHQSGILHRDLKPSNVLVTTEGQVKILDFGLASLQDDFAGNTDPISGTPAYMAPELLEGNPASEASDWYSVGTILYQVLTGQLPHTGNPLEMTQAKLHYEPCPPSLLIPGIPVDLEALCLDLLQRDAARRPSGSAVIARLGGEIEGREAHPSQAQTLAGRAREIAALMEAFNQMRRRRMRIIHLHGEVGMGKSTLIRRFMKEVARIAPESLMLYGRCFEQESVPFKAMDSLVDALSRHLKKLPLETRETLLPPDLSALVRLFPVLRPFARVAVEDPSSDSLQVREKAFTTLRDVFSQLATTHPLILAIDDAHWGDKDSATLISAILSPPDPPPLMLLLASLDEGEAPSPMITRLKEGGTLLPFMVEIRLKELPWTEARSLATALLGPSGEPHSADRIAEESGGSPFLIAEMVRQLQTSGNSPTRDLKNYLQAQIASLPPATRRLLQFLSLAACPLSIELLRDVTGACETLPQGLNLLRNYHLIRVLPSHRRKLLSIYHVQIREVVRAEMDPTAIRETHEALANALEKWPETDPEALSIHFEEAGNREKASEFAALAAERAVSAMAFGKACDLYKKTISLQPPSSHRILELRKALAESLAKAGFGRDAGLTFLEAASEAGVRESIQLKRRAAEEFLRSGHIEEGVIPLKEALHQIGETFPQNRLYAILQVLVYRLRLKFRGYGYVLKDPGEISPDVQDRVDLLWAAAMGLGGVDVIRGGAFQARMILKALDSGDPFRIVRALAHESIFTAHSGTASQEATRRILGKTQGLAEELGHPYSLSRAYMATGIVAMLEGRWKASTVALDRATSMLKENCTGVAYEIQLCLSFTMLAKAVMGEFHDLTRRLPRLLKEAQERGDLLAMTDLRTSVEVPLLLVQDQPELARRVLSEAISRWSRSGFHTQHFHALVAGANIELYAGDPATALEIQNDNWPGIKNSGILHVQCVAITLQELRARTLLALALENGNAALKLKHLNAVDGIIDRIEKEDTTYGKALVLKLRALESLAEGQQLVAQGFLLQAEHAFEACDMTAHTMASRRARCLLEGESGKRILEETELWMTEQTIQNARRFTCMHLPAPLFR